MALLHGLRLTLCHLPAAQLLRRTAIGFIRVTPYLRDRTCNDLLPIAAATLGSSAGDLPARYLLTRPGIGYFLVEDPDAQEAP